jgi:molybdopterin-guanine dinucleotide biosynthesis protein A
MKTATLGAVILAGGASARMGEDKAVMIWGGQRAIDRVAALAKTVGATELIVAGGDYGLPFLPDAAGLHSGPLGGLMGGLRALRDKGCPRALALTADAPTVRPEDLAPLLAAPSPGATYAALRLPLIIDLANLPDNLPADGPVRLLAEGMGLATLEAPAGAALRLRGANTSDERAVLLADLQAPKP